jgi:hypothetical protein
MRHSTLALALAATCAAVPAAAQQTVSLGQTVRGRIEASDPKLADGSHYDIWNYRGRAGERITITLRSSDFDAYLAFGKIAGGECSDDCETDDDGAGGTDSRVTATIGAGGVYQIRANTLSEGETGAYTLEVQAAPPAAPVRSSGNIAVGQTVRGTLDSRDPQADDDSYFDLWTFRGTPGQRITITLRSSDFDAYLGWGRMDGGDWEEMASDDDGAGGTDARLEVTVGGAGVHTIRANTLGGGETGAYTLEVQAGGSGGGDSDGEDAEEEEEPVDLARARPIRAGETVNGSLATSDPKLPDDSYYDAYVYEGRAGERLSISLTSDAFDAFLAFGRMDGSRFEQMEINDDAGEGTHSAIEVTLPTAGRYLIRANSLGGGATGAYTLSVRSSR